MTLTAPVGSTLRRCCATYLRARSCSTEEIFGPVAPVSSFATLDEAVNLANDTEYGLAAYAFTRDLDTAIHLMERIDVGMIGINQGIVSNPAAPFGGVKASGFGREGGAEGIEEYLETRYVGLRPLEAWLVDPSRKHSLSHSVEPVSRQTQVGRSPGRLPSGCLPNLPARPDPEASGIVQSSAPGHPRHLGAGWPSLL